ncbi:unnamed protein product [Rotaria sp. Silwood1]|nr:unnamed protein product [Rotaria sp. Silwood1]CAF3560493.1 unnamed protein product [Rotaria sp. Silwood1]CAF4831832.1 unnamed protein product [Rotaria sp. Silwood1]
MLGDRKTVVLRGGAPWGFRLSGGGQTPIYIAKVRSRSKAAFGGLATGDTIISVNGISSLQHSLREINDIIDTVRDQLIIEVQSTTNTRGFRLDSSSSIDTRESSPVRPIQRIISQPRQMDYHQYTSSRTTPTYPSYTSTSGTNYFNNTNLINEDQYFMDSYGRSMPNPLPAMFRTATITTNSPATPITTARVQQFSYRPSTSNSTYDTPRNYNETIASGYLSDTNDLRRSSISVRPTNGTTSNIRYAINQQPYLTPSTTTYTTKLSSGNEQNYYSDSEYVTSGPRYYKITRQVNTNRRPSNVVLPIRSIISKAYDQFVPPEQPKPPEQQIFDVYRYQQEQQRLEREHEQREKREREREQRERERQEQILRKLYQQQQQQQATSNRFHPSPKITIPSQTTIDHELGAELIKSPIANKKRYADSSFFKTPFNTYPTIEEQKQMARKIASILEGGDPTQKGSTKFEKQRQRVDKYTIESDTTNYRPLRPLQTNDSLYSNRKQQQQQQQQQSYYNSFDVPECIKHSLDEAQYINPLRYVGAPEEFKQIHMQEHVTHTNVPPQAAMSLVADLNQNRSKGAALFQKRKARSEKWIIDENNVKKQGYQTTSNYIGPTTKPWGQRAPSWSDSEGPSFSPVRPTFNPSPGSILPESIISPTPIQTIPRYGDFNAKPKGFGTWHAENLSPRGSIDARKPLNLNIEPSIREGIAESHTRSASQPWSPPNTSQSIFSPNQQQTTTTTTTNHFNYPSENLHSKWKNQDYSSWNQSKIQDQRQSQMPMTHDGIDNLRQRLTQSNQSYSYSGLNQRSSNNTSPNPYPSSQRSQQQQQQHFTDL